MGLFTRKPRPARKTVVADVVYPHDDLETTEVFDVEPSSHGIGVIFYGDKPAFLYPGGKMSMTSDVNQMAVGQWRPHQGWSDLDLVAAGFPPPPLPDRPVVEQLALAVLGGDKTAWRPLIDAALEELGGA
jgi:hypothetical protein